MSNLAKTQTRFGIFKKGLQGCSPCQAPVNGRVGDRQDSARLLQGHGVVIEEHDSCTPSIEGLFKIVAPGAIVRRISLAIIRAINGVFRRWFAAHVSKEVRKVVPSLANGNAASSVAREVFASRIQTAIAHSMPCPIFWRCATSSMAVFRSVHRAGYLLQTFATSYAPRLQWRPCDAREVSAITSAKPSRSTSGIVFFCARKDGQFPKSLTGYIDETSHVVFLSMATVACSIVMSDRLERGVNCLTYV